MSSRGLFTARGLAEVRRHPSRYAAVLAAIAISVAFLSACLVFLGTEQNAIEKSVLGAAARADLVVAAREEPGSDNPGNDGSGDDSPGASTPVPAVTSRLAGVEKVTAVEAQLSTGAESAGRYLQLLSAPAEPFTWTRLTTGRWPSGPGEITLTTDAAEHLGATVGGSVTVQVHGGDTPAEKSFVVVGTTVSTSSLFSGLNDLAFVDPVILSDAPAQGTVWTLQIAPGADPELVRDQVVAVLHGTPLQVWTAHDYAQLRLSGMTAGADVFRAILLSFGAIALLVGALIIANTFTILLAQRRRSIGLLRAVGASSDQVRRDLTVESVLVGAVGASLGVALGAGLAALGAAFSGSLSRGLVLPWPVAIVWLGGVVMTVLAALVPSLRAAGTSPMEALRPPAEPTGRRALGPVALTIASICGLGGAALLVWAWQLTSQALLVTIVGSFLVALAVLLAAPIHVPPLVRLLAAVPAKLSVTARMAGANAARNPRRTAATCLALMLTVGLVVTLQVGTASAKASAEAGLADRYPVPLTVQSYDEAGLPADLVDRVGAAEGISAAVGVESAPVQSDLFFRALGAGPEVERVAPGARVGDDEVLVSPDLARGYGLSEGDMVTLGGDRARLDLRLRVSHLAGWDPVVSRTTLHRLARQPVLGEVWAGVADQRPEHAKEVVAGVRKLVEDVPSVTVGGSLAELVSLRQVLDMLLLITTALLGVAVLIALIGVGNTLALSVLERTRESALLRALGLQRGQLRWMLAVEALLLALVGALIGIAAGAGFGFLGARALLAEVGQPVVFAMSPVQTAADVGVAVVAGLAASVLPARRALRSSPTEALAEV